MGKKLSFQKKYIIILSTVLFALILLTTYILQDNYVLETTQAYISQQYNSIQQKVIVLQNIIQKNDGATLDKKLQEEMVKIDSDVNLHWFLYTNDRIIYDEKNQYEIEATTTYSQLFSSWKAKNGVNIDLLPRLMKKGVPYVEFSKSANDEMQFMLAEPFVSENTEYIIGITVAKEVLFEHPIMKQSFLILYSMCIFSCLILIIYTLLLLHKTSVLKKEHQDKEEMAREQKAQFVRMEQEVKQRRQQVKDHQLMDAYAIFYNREYFYTFLLNMSRQNLKSLSMIILQMENTHLLIRRYGVNYEQKISSQINQMVQEILPHEVLIAKINEQRIIISMINDDYKEVAITCGKLEHSILQLDLEIKVKAYFMLQKENESAFDMYGRILQTIPNHIN